MLAHDFNHGHIQGQNDVLPLQVTWFLSSVQGSRFSVHCFLFSAFTCYLLLGTCYLYFETSF